MRNPLNDMESFAALCGGAGFAFGVAAVLTVGSPVTSQLAKLSLITLVFAGVCSLACRLCEHAGKYNERKEENDEQLH